MKKIAVTGATGFIGQELMKSANMIPLSVDVRDAVMLGAAIRSEKPDLIVHLAAITDVTICEQPENQKMVNDVNVLGTFNTAEAASNYGCGMVFISSFQVFNGKKMFLSSYKEWEKCKPVNYYGLTKMYGERLREVFTNMKVVRAPYLFNYEKLKPDLRELNIRDVQYPTFMHRNFMHLNNFVSSLVRYCENFDSMPDILHLGSDNTVSFFDFMRSIAYGMCTKFDALPRDKNLYGEVNRPLRAGLNCSKSFHLGFECRQVWDEIVTMMMIG